MHARESTDVFIVASRATSCFSVIQKSNRASSFSCLQTTGYHTLSAVRCQIPTPGQSNDQPHVHSGIWPKKHSLHLRQRHRNSARQRTIPKPKETDTLEALLREKASNLTPAALADSSSSHFDNIQACRVKGLGL